MSFNCIVDVVKYVVDVIRANPATFSVFGMMALNALSGSLLRPGEKWNWANIYKMFYNFFQLMISYKTGHPTDVQVNPTQPDNPAKK